MPKIYLTVTMVTGDRINLDNVSQSEAEEFLNRSTGPKIRFIDVLGTGGSKVRIFTAHIVSIETGQEYA